MKQKRASGNRKTLSGLLLDREGGPVWSTCRLAIFRPQITADASAKMMIMIILVLALCIVLLAVKFTDVRRAGEPPLVGGRMPYVGAGLAFRRDPLKFFLATQ